METGEGPPIKINPLLRSVRALKEGARRFLEGFSPEPKEIPLEEINEASLAKAISENLGNRLRERLGQGKRWDIPFSIVDVLAVTGRVATWTGADYQEKFPDEYRLVRGILQKLANAGILEIIPLEKPDENRETMYYRVIDKELLGKIAAQATSK